MFFIKSKERKWFGNIFWIILEILWEELLEAPGINSAFGRQSGKSSFEPFFLPKNIEVNGTFMNLEPEIHKREQSFRAFEDEKSEHFSLKFPKLGSHRL